MLGLIFALVKWKMLKQEDFPKVDEKRKLNPAIEPTLSIISNNKSKEPFSINVAMFERPLLRLTLDDILRITNNFCKTNIIGDGGFGTVYKAVLPDGRTVARKNLG